MLEFQSKTRTTTKTTTISLFYFLCRLSYIQGLIHPFVINSFINIKNTLQTAQKLMKWNCNHLWHGWTRTMAIMNIARHHHHHYDYFNYSVIIITILWNLSPIQSFLQRNPLSQYSNNNYYDWWWWCAFIAPCSWCSWICFRWPKSC